MSLETSKPSKNLSRLSSELLSQDQQDAVTDLYEGNRLIVAKMGAGKTVIAATTIAELLQDKVVKRVLIVSTPKIANTVWEGEFDKWQHTHNVTVKAATGDPEERKADILAGAQVVVITFNVLQWMKKEKLFDHFDGLLIDETTKLKTVGGAQFKALRPQLKKFVWRGGLTGTPVSEDFEGLYAQCMLIDLGAALGKNKQVFLDTYFYPTDFKRYNWALKPNAEKEILDKVKNLVHVVPDYRGELEEPDYKSIILTMPSELREYYETMKRDMVTDDAVSQTAAVLSQKLQQITSGFIYDEEGRAKRLSTYRSDRLAKLLDELGDKNVLICYWYQEDLDHLKGLLPDAEVLDKKKLKEQVKRWNNKQIKQLLIHPRSAGHGLQLEQGGHTLIWYTPQWSNDLWEQTNARIWRKGQQSKVTIYSLEAENSIDEIVSARIESKSEFDKVFTKHLGEKNG